MCIRDSYKGDKKNKLRTLSICIGKKNAGIIAAISLLIGVIITPLPFICGYLSLYYMIIILIADIMSFISIYYLPEILQNETVRWISLIAGIALFIYALLKTKKLFIKEKGRGKLIYGEK